MSHSIVTLLSDLGTQDTTVPVAKATLLRQVTDVTIVDISHNVAQYDLQQAAYLLLSAYDHFEKGTVHILPIDVFAGSAPSMLIAQKDGYFFVAPDNGILPLAFGSALENTCHCFQLTKPYSFNEWMLNAGKIVAAIKAGAYHTFPACEVKKAPRTLQPRLMPDGVECNILYVDRYENIVLDMTREQFDAMVRDMPFSIQIMRTHNVTVISNNYNDVGMYEPLCRFNTAGFLEIAFNHSPAASSLGLGSFSTGNLRYQTIKILFQKAAE